MLLKMLSKLFSKKDKEKESNKQICFCVNPDNLKSVNK